MHINERIPARGRIMEEMHRKVFQLLVDNTSGVLSRISGLFSRRGYNIESITAGTTANPLITRITIVASGDDDILDQIEKQLRKLIDVRDIHELRPEESVYRELAMIKVACTDAQRQGVIALANIFRAGIIDVAPESAFWTVMKFWKSRAPVSPVSDAA